MENDIRLVISPILKLYDYTAAAGKFLISTWSSHAHGVAKVRSEQCPVVTLFGTKVLSGTLVARNLQGTGQIEQLIWEPALEPRQLGRHQRLLLELNV